MGVHFKELTVRFFSSPWKETALLTCQMSSLGTVFSHDFKNKECQSHQYGVLVLQSAIKFYKQTQVDKYIYFQPMGQIWLNIRNLQRWEEINSQEDVIRCTFVHVIEVDIQNTVRR